MEIPWLDVAISVLFLGLTWLTILRPLNRCNRRRAQARWQEAYREHQLEAITRLHPLFLENRYLQRLTWKEIEHTYSVQQLYNQIR